MAIKLDFKQSTWDKAKPKDLKKDPLSAALKDVEKTSGDEKKLAACIAALNEAKSAAEGHMDGECSPKKNKDLFSALKKFVSECEDEIERCQDKMEGAESEDDEDGDIDKLLNVAKFPIFLKKAKSASTAEDGAGFCFCFHKQDGTQCKLVLEMAAKVNSRYAKLKSRLPKFDSEFKKRNIVTGMAYRDEKFLVLECFPGEEPPEVPGMDKKLRAWAKSHKADISPMKKVRMSIPGMAALEIDVPEEGEVETPETETDASAADVGTPPKAPPTPDATTSGGPSTVPPTAPPTTNGAPDAAAEQRRADLRGARSTWVSALSGAVQTMEAVKDCIRNEYLDDPEMFKVATSKLGQLDASLDKIGDDLRDLLDKYVSTPKSRGDELHNLGNQIRDQANQFIKHIQGDALLNAVDNETEMGMSDLKVREPLLGALNGLLKTLV